ncbi:MAG TPA: SurA N-terminal domain-containing protein, partial [Candidatus Angelobacter sp.]|nr:SurA N-terminal domain-containing protein [Candidatus Angelobacter sp.]
MRLRVQLAILLLGAAAASAQVVDRMVAVVNKRVILESELDQNVRVECLLQGKSLDKFSAAERAAVLDQMIDRALLEQQIMTADVLDPTPPEVAAQLSQVRQQVANANTDEGWKAALAAYGLSQQDVEEHLISEFRLLRFVDLRFRGLVRVDKNAVTAYYQEKFLPELRRRGAQEPPLSQVSEQIEKILAEQSIDQMLGRWLETLRAQAHIEKMG